MTHTGRVPLLTSPIDLAETTAEPRPYHAVEETL